MTLIFCHLFVHMSVYVVMEISLYNLSTYFDFDNKDKDNKDH